MKKSVALLVFMHFVAVVFALEIIPPDMRVLQLVKEALKSDEVTLLWGVDYDQILKSDKTMTKKRVSELLKSIDPSKIKLAKDYIGTLEIKFSDHLTGFSQKLISVLSAEVGPCFIGHRVPWHTVDGQGDKNIGACRQSRQPV